jgi:predicted nucleotidyltransferase component of viral defense system
MELYKSLDFFNLLIESTSSDFDLNPVIVEKDYFVVLILKELVKKYPNLVFKGGTSLSKCFHVINRFSEDVDITLSDKEIGTKLRSNFYKDVSLICDKLNFKIVNQDEIKERYKFNKFIINYGTFYDRSILKPYLILECAFFMNSFPTKKKEISSYIYDFLKKEKRYDLITKYELEPFAITVQSIERTFVDKVFAICDYYLENDLNEHSRHLYDLFKIFPLIKINDNLQSLIKEVRAVRLNDSRCLSAKKDINEILTLIVDSGVYKNDYLNNTSKLIKDDVTYDDCIKTIKKIIDLKIF